jgi:outer membrane receptor for ferric coprogen and ferric-rhodotorulic acid
VVSEGERDYFYDHAHGRKSLAFGAIEYDLTPQTILSLSLSSQDHEVKAASGGLPRYTNGTLLDVPRSTNNLPDWNNKLYQTDETAASVEHRFDNKWVAKASSNHREQHLHEKQAYYSTGVNPVTNVVTYKWNRNEIDYTRDGLDTYVTGPFEMFGRTHSLLLGYNSDVYHRTGLSVISNFVANVPFGNLAPIATEPETANQNGRDLIIEQYGTYSQLRLSIADPLTLVLGGRRTTYKSRSRNIAPSVETNWVEARDKADNRVTPYGGVLYDVTRQVTLYGSYADIFIPQTQLMFTGDTLEPRVGKQYELGGKADLLNGNLGASLAWFNMRDNNRAYADPNHATYYLAAGEVESKGWEVELVGKPLAGLEIMAGYTRLTTRYLTDRNSAGKQFSLDSPKHQLKFWANYRFSGETLDGLSVGLGGLVSSRFANSLTTQGQGGYAVMNGQIAYRIDKTYWLSLLANNLFDRKYFTSLGGASGGNVYGDPRNFLLTLRAAY